MFLGQFSENSQGKGCCFLGELLLQIISCHIIVMKKDGDEVLDVIIREVCCKQYLRPTYSEMSFCLFPVSQNTSTFKIEDRLEKPHSVI